ncbi:unnamed protein product [Gordionus sp. m RMFG-2023]
MVEIDKIKFLKPNGNLYYAAINEEREIEEDSNYSSVIYNSFSKYSIQKQCESLPIYSFRRDIYDALENYQTIIIVGETGSGKTTQLPKYLIEWGWTDYINESNKMKICLVQPRRIAVIKSAARIAEEYGVVLGHQVGYVIRFESCFDSEKTKVKVVTRGILLREMLKDPLLSAYSILILDEAHERSVEMDIIFGLVRKVLKKRPTFRLIISSATLDVKDLVQYFDLKNESLDSKSDISTLTTINVKYKNYYTEIYYLQKPIIDYIEGSVLTILDILRNTKYGDILVFLPGKDEIERCMISLNEKNSKLKSCFSNLLIFPLFASLPDKDQYNALEPALSHKRKCIISTNVAETSLTINGIVYVIDCGYEKIKFFNNYFSLEILGIHAISKASAIQRAGRAGRTSDGKVFRLYTEQTYENLRETCIPEIQRCDLVYPILQLKSFAINIISFNYISQPPAKNVMSALETLYFLKAIDENGMLTPKYGKLMTEFPFSPMFSRMILKSLELNCACEIIYITSMLQIKNVFINNPARRLQAETKKLCNFAVKEGDHITYLNVFRGYLSALSRGKDIAFCRESYINQKGMRRAYHIYKQLTRHILSHRQDFLSGSDTEKDIISSSLDELDKNINDETSIDKNFNVLPNTETLIKCIIAGFFHNVAYYHISGNYKTVKDDYGPLKIHPDSVICSQNPPPKYVIFNEILYSSKASNDVLNIYMYDIVSLPPNACTLLSHEIPEYFLFGTPNQRHELQIKFQDEII